MFMKRPFPFCWLPTYINFSYYLVVPSRNGITWPKSLSSVLDLRYFVPFNARSLLQFVSRRRLKSKWIPLQQCKSTLIATRSPTSLPLLLLGVLFLHDVLVSNFLSLRFFWTIILIDNYRQGHNSVEPPSRVRDERNKIEMVCCWVHLSVATTNERINLSEPHAALTIQKRAAASAAQGGGNVRPPRRSLTSRPVVSDKELASHPLFAILLLFLDNIQKSCTQ